MGRGGAGVLQLYSAPNKCQKQVLIVWYEWGQS